MNIIYTSQFKRDYKRIQRQNKDIDKLKEVVEKLFKHQTLAQKHKDHKLFGQWHRHRECHIEPDWLLIYRFKGDDLILERTGSHSELFR